MLFYGRQLNMNEQEIMNTTFGEMIDLISCLSIYNGGYDDDDFAPPKKKITDYEAAMRLR